MALTFGPPVLADDDQVVLQVLRMCRATLSGQDVVGGGGLVLADIKAFLFDHRDEYREYAAYSSREGEVWTEVRWWGADAVIHDNLNPITVSTALPHTGYWKLTVPRQDVVLVHGYAYDVNLAASDTLDAWAAALKLEFDFNDGSGTYNRSQKVANLEAMARKYRGRGFVQTVPMFRSDQDQNEDYALPPESEGWSW